MLVTVLSVAVGTANASLPESETLIRDTTASPLRFDRAKESLLGGELTRRAHPVFEAVRARHFSGFALPRLAERVRREAPSAVLEWVARDAQALLAVAEGQVDIALMPAAQPLSNGLDYAAVKPLKWASFVRKRHPATEGWGRAAWSKWPHVAVRVGARVPSPVDTAVRRAGGRRKIAAWVPQFSAVAPLLSRTDLIATLPMVAMVEALDRFGLRARKSPIHLGPMPHRLVWSQRLDNDPAIRWLRGHVEAAFREVLDAADATGPA